MLSTLFVVASLVQVTQPVPDFDLNTQFTDYPTPASGIETDPGGPAVVQVAGSGARYAFSGADPSLIYSSALRNGPVPELGYQLWFSSQVTSSTGSKKLGIAWAYAHAPSLGTAAEGQDFVKDRYVSGPNAGDLKPALFPTHAWEANGVETCSVMEDPNAPGYYWMFYAGRQSASQGCSNSPKRYQIGVAYGLFGTTFTSMPQPIIPAGTAACGTAAHEWDAFAPLSACTSSGPREPSVMIDPHDPSRLLMWYEAFDACIGKSQIGYAVCDNYLAPSSGDPNVPNVAHPSGWTKMGVVYAPNNRRCVEGGPQWESVVVSHTNVLADPTVGFHLFNYAHASNGGCGSRINHAYSADGITMWQRRQCPIFQSQCCEGSPECPEYDRVGGPTSFLEGGRIELYYMTGQGSFTNAYVRRAHSD